MVFSSITFLYLFFPLTLLLYALVGRKGRNGVLLFMSLLFYAQGEPRYLPLLLLSLCLLYGCSQLLPKVSLPRRTPLFLLGLFTALSPLLFFKYADFLLENLTALGGPALHVGLPLPLGISFYTFQMVGYLVDVYRGDIPPARSFVDFAAYVTFFPQLIAGPIIRYKDIEEALYHRRHTLEDVQAGTLRFLAGLGKKVLLANLLGTFLQEYAAALSPTVLYAWLSALAFALQIYLDFSAYSDMALGMGQILGFHFPENFRYPYLATSITDFWRRWHISLGRFFRDYVYIPLGGNRVPPLLWTRNLLVVWVLTGLWHGAAWSFLLWGLYFFVLLYFEKQWGPMLSRSFLRPLRRLYVLLAVLLSFVLFEAGSLPEALLAYGRLFGLSGLPFQNEETLYALKNYGGLFVAALLGSTPYPRLLFLRWRSRRKPSLLSSATEGLFLMLLLVLVTAELVDGSFNPFLYFRF